MDPDPSRTTRIWVVVGIGVASFSTGFAIWMSNRPIEEGSFVFWVGAVFMGAPIWLALEGVGEMLFAEKLGLSMTRPGRIVYGVFIMATLLILISLVGHLFLSGFGL